ncbi:hypothetical protein B0H21DRAFT_776245 [Amylocystis lapponica]|nr:hypothetical protein B0H21DRAFT_776245 [Amylocystis lapponica]
MSPCVHIPALEHAKRAFALREYEAAVDHYATALELITATHGEDAPELADLYFSYGKALLENAIAQSSVLGKEQPDDAVAGNHKKPEAGGSGAFLSFSGDADDDDDDAPVDLFAEAARAAADADADADADAEGEDDEGEDDAEPEDDFNAAWEVLDLARALYEKQQDGDDAVKLKLADTYMALGDVSLETEKFDQAITDFGAGLELKRALLPFSSRQIAEVHYKLSIVLDLTPGRLSDAIVHAERALESVEARLAELRDTLSGQSPAKPELMDESNDEKGKGKGRATASLVLADDSIQKMTKPQMEGEVKELTGLKEDLALKVRVEELKSPDKPDESAPALAAKALDSELNASSASTGAPPQTMVNDLTGIVKKKKKAPEANGTGKRKAEDEDMVPSSSEKKAKRES